MATELSTLEVRGQFQASSSTAQFIDDEIAKQHTQAEDGSDGEDVADAAEEVQDVQDGVTRPLHRHRIGSFDSQVEYTEDWPEDDETWKVRRYCGDCLQCPATERQTGCPCWRWFASFLLDRLNLRLWISYLFMQNVFLAVMLLGRCVVHGVYLHSVAHLQGIGPVGLFLTFLSVILSPMILAPAYKLAYDALGAFEEDRFHMRHGVMWLGYSGKPGEEPFLRKFHEKVFWPPLQHMFADSQCCGIKLFMRWAESRYAMDDLCLLVFYFIPTLVLLANVYLGWRFPLSKWIVASSAGCLLFQGVLVMDRMIRRCVKGLRIMWKFFTCKEKLENPTCPRVFVHVSAILWLSLISLACLWVSLAAFVFAGPAQGVILTLSALAAIPAQVEEHEDFVFVRESRFRRVRRSSGRCFCCWDFFYTRGLWYFFQTAPLLVVGLLLLPSAGQQTRQYEGTRDFNHYGMTPWNVSRLRSTRTWDTRNQPEYPVCNMRWSAAQDLTMLDLALLTSTSYCNDAAAKELTEMYFGYNEWQFQGSGGYKSQQVIFKELYHPGKNMSVVVVRGTFSAYDAIVDLEMLGDAGAIKFWPMMLLFPDYTIRAFLFGIGFLCDTLFFPDSGVKATLFGDLNDYVADLLPRRKDILLTGHSLGGSVAQVVAMTYDLPVVTFAAPGVGYSLERFGIPDATDNINERMGLNVHDDEDPVSYVGYFYGLTQVMNCRFPVCHKLVSTRCELLQACGDTRDRPLLYAQCYGGSLPDSGC